MKALVLTLALLTAAPAAPARVVINEILYHAPGDLDLEYVELHNSGAADVDLGGWRFTAGIKYTFPDGASIPAGGYLVLARNGRLFAEFYSIRPFASYQGSLSNNGETLALANAEGEIVESVAFSDRAPWPLSADGYSASLERVSPGAPAEKPANWVPSPLSDDSGAKPAGTPGAKNRGFSASLPPLIKDLSVGSTVRRPGEAINVHAHVQKSGAELQEVEVLYRVVEPGNEGKEVALRMNLESDGHASAAVPGQPANRIVRIRVRATDKAGAVRVAPPEYEVRTAMSVWVGEPVAAGKIAVAQIINVGSDEYQRAKEYVQNQRRPQGRGGFRGRPRFSEADRARMEAGRRLSSAALERAWATFVLERSIAADKRDALAAVFRSANDSLAKLRAELEKATKVAEFVAEMPGRLGTARKRLTEDTKRVLGADDITADDLALLQSFGAEERGGREDRRGPDRRGEGERGRRGRDFGRGERGDRRRGGGFDGGMERMFNVEASLFRASMLPGVTAEQLDRLQEIHNEALAKRKSLMADAEDGDFREVFGRVRDLRDDLRDDVDAVLTREQRSELAAGDRDRGRFGREPGGRGRGDRGRGDRGRGGRGFGRFGSRPPTPLPPQGRSAFVYTDPQTGESELFDFVHIVERKSGYKVRLHRDRPLAGSTTINVLYESDERSILTEALAYELYRLAGNATPWAGYLRVLIDGQLAGYHLMFEQPNGAFFRRHDIAGGNLYKVIWQGSNRPSQYTPPEKLPERGDIVGRHEKKTNEHDGYEDLIALVEALENAKEPAKLWEVIQKRFDVDQVINYFAVNTLLSHWDGFFNNYFLYHDVKGTRKWTMYPWDQDSTWGHRMNRGRGEGEVGIAQIPLTFGMEGDVPPGGARARPEGRGGFRFFGRGGPGWWRQGGEISRPLLANPQCRRRFLQRLEVLAKTVYTEAVFEPKFRALREQLVDEVRLRAKTAGRSEEDAVRYLDDTLAFFREHLVKRREYVLANIGKEIEKLEQPEATVPARRPSSRRP